MSHFSVLSDVSKNDIARTQSANTKIQKTLWQSSHKIKAPRNTNALITITELVKDLYPKTFLVHLITFYQTKR